MKRFFWFVAGLSAIYLGYLLAWPVPVQPVAWNAPEDLGYVGDYEPNDRLAGILRVPLGGFTGPEDVAIR